MLQLVATPDNPVPPHPHLVEVKTSDGLRLRAAYWIPEGGSRKGTVCVIQGRAEFIEKYYEVVRELLQRGFAVVAFDWRGQGLSGRQVKNPRKGHVRRFADFRRDIEAIRDQVLVPFMPEPHFALAHSMGGAIALNAAYEGWLPFRRLVTTAPMIAISMVPYARGDGRVAADPEMAGLRQGLRAGRRRDVDLDQALQGQPADERPCPLRPQRPCGQCRRRRGHRRADDLLARWRPSDS